MSHVVLVSFQYFESRRKVGFHWLAEAYWALGWDVTFATVSLSHLSRLRRDARLAYPVRREANVMKELRPRLHSFVLFTPLHPANLRSSLLNALSAPAMRRYGHSQLGALADAVRAADLVIFESTPGLLLFDRFKHLNPDARFVYRVSDDLRYNRNHPVVIDEEERVASCFDLISVPSASIFERFRALPNVVLHNHGIDKASFDALRPSPYAAGSNHNAVFVGALNFDHEFIELAAPQLPDWCFHLVGPITGVRASTNVVLYGEVPWDETIPYIQHADVGLQTLAYRPGAESLTDTPKILQYTYCRLPIVAPEFLRSPRSNLVYYRPGDAESVRSAMLQASTIDRDTIDRSGVRSWAEVALALVTDGPNPAVGMTPATG